MFDVTVTNLQAGKPCSRRSMLRASLFGAGAIGLSPWIRPALAGQTPHAGRSVIQIWLAGGPSHLDLYDLKPHAPVEYRGPFQSIATSLPGLEICEHLPLQARIMDRFAVVRSLHHSTNDHVAGTHWMQTGHFGATAPRPSPTHPSAGAVISRLRSGRQTGMLPYIHIAPELNIDLYTRHFGSHSLGAAHEPLNVRSPFPPWNKKDVNFGTPALAPVSGLDLGRLQDRLQLSRQFDELNRMAETAPMQVAETHHRQAMEMLAGGTAREAFDLTREPEKVRRKYGRHPWGQGALLCRRLVEAGASFVTLNTDSSSNMWDNHGGLENYLKMILPLYDQMLTALIDDLRDRGMQREVLVVVCGEFGRTPLFNKRGGRDHWGRAGCALLAGGNLKSGTIIGATNAKGELPTRRPITPGDILATIYHHLDINLATDFTNHQGRPIPLLSEGTPIAEFA